VHNFGTCVWRTAAQWRLPGKKRVSTQEKSDFETLDFGKLDTGILDAVLDDDFKWHVSDVPFAQI